MTAPAGSRLRQVHREHTVLARKNPYVGRTSSVRCQEARSGQRRTFLDFCRACPRRHMRCAHGLVGRSCEFGTDASLEAARVVIKTGDPR
jgi:hypothetical protein